MAAVNRWTASWRERGERFAFFKSKDNMPIKINDKTLQVTKKCQRSFGCLDNEKLKMCTIERCIDGINGCYLKTVTFRDCNYQISLVNSAICSCPTRFELYKKYGI